MFETSEAYRESLDGGYLDTDIKGTLTLTDGTIYEIAEKDVIPSSLSFDNKAINSNDFCFGGAYVGELSIDLLKQIDRYSLNDAEIKLSYFQTTLSGEIQEIPLGIFYVYEATRTKKIISLKAYDAMTKFDVDVDESITGYMYDILTYISEKCGVPLAQTEEQIEAFTNAGWWLTLDMENISTYREAISQMGLLSGQFATIDRNGALLFRKFSTDEVQDSVSAKRRTESSIQDFRTYFCGVKARFIANTNYYPYEAVDETIENGLVLDLGDIPLFMGEDESKKEIMNNLLAMVTKLIYVPTEFSTISDPSVDLGDCIELKNVNGSESSVVTMVHSLSWKYHGTQKITCYGSDPKLVGVTSKEERMLSQVETQISAKDLVVKTYTNSKKLTVTEAKEQEVFLFNFATTAKTTVMFMGTVPFESTLDGKVIFRTYLDGVIDDSATVSACFDRGSHVVSLTNYFPMSADGRATLKITAITEYFESDGRRDSANIVSILDYVKNQGIEVDTEGVPHLTKEYAQQDIDTTPPTVTIKKSTIKGLLFAQGIAGAGQWDGTINVTEDFSPVSFDTTTPFGAITLGEFMDSPLVKSTDVLKTENGESFISVHKVQETKVADFAETESFSTEEVPHGDGTDSFAPVSLDGRFLLNFMSTSITTDLDEGGD